MSRATLFSSDDNSFPSFSFVLFFVMLVFGTQKNSSSDEFLRGTGEGDMLPLLSEEPLVGNTLGFLAVDGTLG